MRILLFVISVLAVGWAGYWFVGQAGLKHGVALWFEDRRAQGWVATYSALDVQGFPNRFDTNLSDLRLADPHSGLAWETPFFQILALSYRPNHIIAAWPNRQSFATAQDRFQLDSTDMRASVIIGANAQLPLERATLTAQALALTPQSTAQPVTASALRLGVTRQPARPATYRLGLAADDVAPARDWRALLDPSGQWPDMFETLSADMTVRFDKPWDRDAVETARPQPQDILIKLAEARWGRMQIRLSGQLTMDQNGIPDGEIVITAHNWRDMLGMAVISGLVPEGLAATLETTLPLIAQPGGNPETLDVSLGFTDGFMRLGPVPLGPAPVLKLR